MFGLEYTYDTSCAYSPVLVKQRYIMRTETVVVGMLEVNDSLSDGGWRNGKAQFHSRFGALTSITTIASWGATHSSYTSTLLYIHVCAAISIQHLTVVRIFSSRAWRATQGLKPPFFLTGCESLCTFAMPRSTLSTGTTGHNAVKRPRLGGRSPSYASLDVLFLARSETVYKELSPGSFNLFSVHLPDSLQKVFPSLIPRPSQPSHHEVRSRLCLHPRRSGYGLPFQQTSR